MTGRSGEWASITPSPNRSSIFPYSRRPMGNLGLLLTNRSMKTGDSNEFVNLNAPQIVMAVFSVTPLCAGGHQSVPEPAFPGRSSRRDYLDTNAGLPTSAVISAKPEQRRQALGFLAESRGANLFPDVITYSAIISAKPEQWLQTIGFLAKPRNVNLLPDVITFSATISACEKPMQWLQTFGLLAEPPSVDLLPNVITYHAATSARGKSEQGHQALDLPTESRSLKLPPSMIAYNATVARGLQGVIRRREGGVEILRAKRPNPFPLHEPLEGLVQFRFKSQSEGNVRSNFGNLREFSETPGSASGGKPQMRSRRKRTYADDSPCTSNCMHEDQAIAYSAHAVEQMIHDSHADVQMIHDRTNLTYLSCFA